MEDVTRSMGERILLAAKLAATLHLLEDVKEIRRLVNAGGTGSDRFTDGAPSTLAGRTPGEIPGRSDF